MKQSLKISRENEQIQISQTGKMTVDEAISLSFEMFARVVMQTKEQLSDDAEARRQMYDLLVVGFSSLMSNVYPEIEAELAEQKGSPEDFMAALEKKSAEIDEKLALLQKLEEQQQNVQQ